MFLPGLLVLSLAAVAFSQSPEKEAREFLAKFSEDAEQMVYKSSKASWNYNVDITDENAEKMVSTLSKIVLTL